MFNHSTKTSSKSAVQAHQANIMGDDEYESVCGWNTNMMELSMNVYDSNDLCRPQEDVTLKVISLIDETYQTMNTDEVFYKDIVEVGNDKDGDIHCKDGYTSLKHCQLNFNNWFGKKASWTKEYSHLLRIRKLPRHICRHIFEFLKEPRRVVITDCGTFNGTFISLNPRQDYCLSGNEVFRFGDELEMTVERSGCIELDEDETFGMVDEKILKKDTPQKQHHIFHDNYKAEEGRSRTYNYLHIQVRFARTPSHYWDFIVVSNKSSSNFSIGSSLEAKLCNTKSSHTDPLQCELILENGAWYVRELPHNDRRRRTWIGLFGNYKDQKKLIKYKGASFAAKPRQNRIEIAEDRDVLVGRIIVQVELGRKYEEGL